MLALTATIAFRIAANRKASSIMEPNRKPTSIPRLFFILISTSLLIIGGVLLAADIKCAYDIEGWWAPPYPDAETVSVTYDLFRPRALGETDWIMESPDDVETVKQWYRDYRLFRDGRGTCARLGLDRDLCLAKKKTATAGLILLKSACGT